MSNIVLRAGPSGPEAPASETSASGISVFNYIPNQYHGQISAGTLPTSVDCGPFITAAIADVGKTDLIIETGTYNIKTPITNDSDDLSMRGAGGAVFKATGNLDTNADGRGAIFYSPDFRFKIYDVTFDCNNQSCNGIFTDRCTFPRLIGGSCINHKAGYAAFRGGSILYLYAQGFNSVGLGRNFDLQKGWELVTTTSYYGANDSEIVFCKGFGREGWRLCGNIDLYKCGLETQLNQPAARGETHGPSGACWVVGEEIGAFLTGAVNFFGCYTEVSVGTVATLVCFFLKSQASAHIYSGEYFGQSSSLVNSTWMVAASFDACSVDGAVKVDAWYYGFDGAIVGSSQGLNSITNLMGASVDKDVNQLFKAGTGVQPGEGLRTALWWGDISYSSKYGLQIATAIRGITITLTPNGTGGDDAHKINLAQSNRFTITSPTPITVDSTFMLNVSNSQRFIFEFATSNITLSNATVGLRGLGDKTFTIGDVIEFVVRTDGTIKEIAGQYV